MPMGASIERLIYLLKVYALLGIILPGSSKQALPESIPVSMLEEFVYCPRQCYIKWVEGEFEECQDVSGGGSQNHNHEDETGDQSQDVSDPIRCRSVYLTGPEIGIFCRIFLREGDGQSSFPVVYKKGEVPSIPEGMYESDQVMLCAQGLVLRENGHICEVGLAYFEKSKKMVPVEFNEALIQRTRDLLAQLRSMAREGKMPPPLQDSPKCYRCSFGGICLPDEVNLLREEKAEPDKQVRLLLPARDDRVPVYVVGQGCSIHKRGDCLEIRSLDGKVSEARLIDISQVCLYGGVEISTPATVELMQRGIPVLHFTHGGWFEGICQGHTNRNVELRLKPA
jgi:CRISP-associated protein Cas1